MTKQEIKFYKHEDWIKYSESVKARDHYTCLNCSRTSDEVVLQVHHTYYTPGVKPWDYPLDACETLCKGCHAREHKLIEPNDEWILISIEDLGSQHGNCQKIGCGQSIRYEFHIYHPQWGYKIVGSTCIDYLSSDQQLKAGYLLNYYIALNTFLSDKIECITTEKTQRFLFYQQSFKYNLINIYKTSYGYAFKILLRIGKKKYKHKELVEIKINCSLEKARALSFLTLQASLEEDKNKIECLKDIYKEIYKNQKM
jgi:hypothetical protein